MLQRIASSIHDSLVDLGKEHENLEDPHENSIGRICEFDASHINHNRHF